MMIDLRVISGYRFELQLWPTAQETTTFATLLRKRKAAANGHTMPKRGSEKRNRNPSRNFCDASGRRFRTVYPRARVRRRSGGFREHLEGLARFLCFAEAMTLAALRNRAARSSGEYLAMTLSVSAANISNAASLVRGFSLRFTYLILR